MPRVTKIRELKEVGDALGFAKDFFLEKLSSKKKPRAESPHKSQLILNSLDHLLSCAYNLYSIKKMSSGLRNKIL